MKKKALLEEIISDREDICTLYTRSNDAKQEISNINRTLKLHGEAHMAQDTVPQFRELCKKVEALGNHMDDLIPGVISNKPSLWTRVVELERNKADAATLSGKEGDKIRTRLADHDESIEALSETVDQLSTCKCEAGNQMLKRIAESEVRITDQGKRLFQVETRIKPMDYDHSLRIVNLETRMDCVTKGDLVLIAEHIDNLDESNRVFLKSIPDIEILKTQMSGVEKTVYNSPFSKIVMEEYAENIKALVRDVDTLKIQMHNLLPVHNNMMTEVLKQKAFLEKVQKILDRARDARIKKSPGYKAEIAAQKKEVKKTCANCIHYSIGINKFDCKIVGKKVCLDFSQWEQRKSRLKMDTKGQGGFSMDKHVDMMVKKGRLRK